MSNWWAILKKELHTLFVSPIAYIVLAVFFAITGFTFNGIAQQIIEGVNMMGFQAQQMGQASRSFDVPYIIIENFFGFVSTVLLFLAPMITMGVFAEEKKQGTVELLFTSPITHLQLILGKFSAQMVFLIILMAPSMLNALILYFYSSPVPPAGPILSAFLGALLFGGALLAVGMFISSLTQSQIIAAVATFGTFLLLLLLNAMTDASSDLVNQVLSYLSLLDHYDEFTKGVIDTQHVVFYLSFIFLGLFLTSTSLDSAKWRQ